MPPKFVFIRHGEAEHNVGFHAEGVSAFSNEKYRDSKLTEKGIEQARAAGQKIAKEVSMDFIDIWCSPLSRCIQTAEEIFEEVNCDTLYLHDNLLECLGGNHICNERMSKTEIAKIRAGWITTYLPNTPSHWIERENRYSVRTRMLMFVFFLADLYKDHSEKEYVLVVSHKDAIFELTGKSMDNAEYVVATVEDVSKL